MQYFSQNLSEKTKQLLEKELVSLQQYLSTIAFNNSEYNQTILEIVDEYKIIKKILDDTERQRIKQNDLFQQQLDQFTQRHNTQREINESTLKEMISLFNIQKQNSDNLLMAQKNQNHEVLMQIIKPQPIAQTILPDGIEQSEIFQQLQQMWSDVYQSSQQLDQKVQTYLSTKTQNNSDFLGSQRNSTSQRRHDLEMLKLDFMNIQDKASVVKQFLEREYQNQNQNNQKILSQAAKLITYYESTFKKSLEFIERLIVELERQTQQNEELMQRNNNLQQNIKKITQKHTKKIEDLQEKFNMAIQEIIKKSNHQQISSQYKQINQLSDFSLQIHNNFYQKIERHLQDVAKSFINISIQNILGSYLSRNNDQSLPNKQDAIIEVQRFSKAIRNLENDDMNKLIDNTKRLLTVFERFFYSAGQDSKSLCFKKSFLNSQTAIDLLNQYLVSIQQGVDEFKREHDELKQLEPNYLV